MPINSTSPNPESKFWSGLGPSPFNSGTPYLTLLVSAGVIFFFVLAIWPGSNPLNRMAYGLFVSVLPALGTLLFLRITKLLVPWYGAATIYLLLFFLIVIVQSFGRMIPVSS